MTDHLPMPIPVPPLAALERISRQAAVAVVIHHQQALAAAEAAPEDWLANTVIDGLCKLLTLRLEGAPPEDAVQGTALAWIEAISYGRVYGPEWEPRLQAAFKLLLREVTRWPSPRQLLECLPRPAPEPPSPRPTAADLQRGKAYLAQIQETRRVKEWLEARAEMPCSLMDWHLAGIRAAMADSYQRHRLYWPANEIER